MPADIIKKSAVRKHAGPKNVGSDFYGALDDRVKELIEMAVGRADGNNRSTIKARDV